MSVTGGKAMIFLTDGKGPTSMGFDKNEITGIAFFGPFSATINTDINGPIVAALT